MARFVLANQDEMVAEWVAKRIPNFTFDGPYSAIGLVNGQGHLLAGVIYERFTQIDIHVHIAAVPGKRWISRHWLNEVFRYPFVQLGCARMTGLVPARNEAAQKFDEHLGFRLEGRLRKALPNGEDLLIYGMLKEECRWLGAGHGHSKRATADSAVSITSGNAARRNSAATAASHG